MTPVEKRILQNQTEIMWTLHYLLECAKPDLVGRAGQLDRMRDDLSTAARETSFFIDANAATSNNGTSDV